MTLLYCPNSSKLTAPNRPGQAVTARAMTSSGRSGRTASLIMAASAANDAGAGAVRCADRQPSPHVVLARAGGRGLLHRLAHVVVAIDDQGGEQVVAAGVVAVDRRGDHAHLAGDRPQGQPGRAIAGQMPAGDLGDLADQLGPYSLSCRTARVHGLD